MTTASIALEHYRVNLQNGRHIFFADEPKSVGGTDTAPTPDELLEASLASCTAITLRMYADRKQWNIETIDVSVHLSRENGKSIFIKNIGVRGDLTNEQKQRLLEIAKACPVSKTLQGTIEIKEAIQ
jgi:putative redox protein